MTALMTARKPQPEDFGITSLQVEQAPELRVPHARPVILLSLYSTVFAVLFAAILVLTRSLSAAVAFAVIFGAAASILVIPLLLCVVCASERAETRWLCRRFPALESCLAYREALKAYRGLKERRQRQPDDLGWWRRLEHPAFSLRVEQRLTDRGVAVTPVRDRALAGYDHEVRIGEDRVLVRCEPGRRPVDIGVGREMTSCLGETGADRAVVVSAAGVTPELEAYAQGRPVAVVDPIRLSV